MHVDGNAAQNYHNQNYSQPPHFPPVAMAMADVYSPNLLLISPLGIPISRLKKQAISARTFEALLLCFTKEIS
jgi:hypothetical protein